MLARHARHHSCGKVHIRGARDEHQAGRHGRRAEGPDTELRAVLEEILDVKAGGGSLCGARHLAGEAEPVPEDVGDEVRAMTVGLVGVAIRADLGDRLAQIAAELVLGDHRGFADCCCHLHARRYGSSRCEGSYRCRPGFEVRGFAGSRFGCSIQAEGPGSGPGEQPEADGAEDGADEEPGAARGMISSLKPVRRRGDEEDGGERCEDVLGGHKSPFAVSAPRSKGRQTADVQNRGPLPYMNIRNEPSVQSTAMKPLVGHWLEPATKSAGKHAEFWMPGGRVGGASGDACSECGARLRLVAIYERGPIIQFEHYEALVLLVCRSCAEETDGYEGSNGFDVKWCARDEYDTTLATFPRLLRADRHFDAEPTGEPTDPTAFQAWIPKTARPKLGGRQVSIQEPRNDPRCRRCGERMAFVGSIPQRWGARQLNFGGGMGYVFVCPRECTARSAFFYWDCS
jgi:hypothetical protein